MRLKTARGNTAKVSPGAQRGRYDQVLMAVATPLAPHGRLYDLRDIHVLSRERRAADCANLLCCTFLRFADDCQNQRGSTRRYRRGFWHRQAGSSESCFDRLAAERVSVEHRCLRVSAAPETRGMHGVGRSAPWEAAGNAGYSLPTLR